MTTRTRFNELARCECDRAPDFCPKHQPKPYSLWSARHRGKPEPRT